MVHNSVMNDVLIEFVLRHINDEWDRLLKEVSALSSAMFLWQPAANAHSIGWHMRHAIEWRYALVHVLICERTNEEELTCLGWEDEPVIRRISSNQGWHEPACSKDDSVARLSRVREITNHDIQALPPARYWETVNFPWRTNQLLDEVFQDTRHSSLHRGHIREIKKAFARAQAVQADAQTSDRNSH
jgi:hypothetical protein